MSFIGKVYLFTRKVYLFKEGEGIPFRWGEAVKYCFDKISFLTTADYSIISVFCFYFLI